MSISFSPLKELYIQVDQSTPHQEICFLLYVTCDNKTLVENLVNYAQSKRLKPNKENGYANFWITQEFDNCYEICLSSSRLECIKVYKDMIEYLNPNIKINPIEWSEKFTVFNDFRFNSN